MAMKVLEIPAERAAELMRRRDALDKAKREFGELADLTRNEVGKHHSRHAHRGEFDEMFRFMVVREDDAK